MKASSANLLSVIKGPKQFIIPIYQRTYSWQKDQCNQLFSDILRIGRDTATTVHFVGSIVYFQESIHNVCDVPKLLVIDGQQRLTTVTLLIAALAEFIRDSSVEIDTTATKLQNYYLFNAEEESELRYKLLLTRQDKETLINIIRGVSVTKEHSQRVAENFAFFKEKINAENAADVYNGILRLFIVDVALEKGVDNPQLIFESLNSTGLDLSQADLIRNYILMGQEVTLQNELYEKHWFPMERSYGNEYSSYFDWFVRDYLSTKTGTIPKIQGVYHAFKDYAQSNDSPNTITEIVADIHQYSGYYVNMVLHQEPTPQLAEGFKRISRLKVDVSYPFLLAIYYDYDNQIITKEQFYEIICLTENYVFRRAICGIPTNSLNKTFVSLYKSIQKENYLESLKAAFQGLSGHRRFPSDSEFKREIVVKNVYNFRNRNYLLDRLENFNEKELVNISNCTIEHILPQNTNLSVGWRNMLGDRWKDIQEQYLHTLGNLTLTAYNSELGDKSFDEKKTIEGGFSDSPIRLSKFLRRTDVWNESQIQARAKELADKAVQIWHGPNLSQEVLSKYQMREEMEDYTLDHYNYLDGEMLALYHALRKRILNIDSSVREERKKLYIAFKSSSNFVDIVPQKSKLKLSLNIKFADLIDPKGLGEDVSEKGRWGNGDVEIGLCDTSQTNDVMDLIQQAFDKQSEDV